MNTNITGHEWGEERTKNLLALDELSVNSMRSNQMIKQKNIYNLENNASCANYYCI